MLNILCNSLTDEIRFVTLHKNELRIFGENQHTLQSKEQPSDITVLFEKSFSYPTSLSLSNASNDIFVGFSDGKVSKYSIDAHNNPSCETLSTVTVHASSIKIMRTFHISQPATSRTQKNLIPRKVLVLLVCDESGLISVWGSSDDSTAQR